MSKKQDRKMPTENELEEQYFEVADWNIPGDRDNSDLGGSPISNKQGVIYETYVTYGAYEAKV